MKCNQPERKVGQNEKHRSILSSHFRRRSLFIFVLCRRSFVSCNFFISPLSMDCVNTESLRVKRRSLNFFCLICLQCLSLFLFTTWNLRQFSVDCLYCTVQPHTRFRSAISGICVQNPVLQLQWLQQAAADFGPLASISLDCTRLRKVTAYRSSNDLFLCAC